MKVAELLQARRANWSDLEQLCARLETRSKRRLEAPAVARFAALYRAACADLALADAYQLPSDTVQYLHQLVGRAHNQLYRSRTFNVTVWGRTLLVNVPRAILGDRCIQLCVLLFFGTFVLSGVLAATPGIWPEYAERIVGRESLIQMETMFEQGIDRAGDQDVTMAGFYIRNNVGIGLQCFAGGLLIIPGLYKTLFNAAFLGAVFGYMARPDTPGQENFVAFVTAHAPFELTAIALAAGAGLRLGMAFFVTGGFARTASLRRVSVEMMPVMGASMILFFLAAMIEGFVSPSATPLWVKGGVATVSIVLLFFYFILLGHVSRKGA